MATLTAFATALPSSAAASFSYTSITAIAAGYVLGRMQLLI